MPQKKVTVKWLKAQIRKKCPAYSKLRKAELIKRAKELGVSFPNEGKYDNNNEQPTSQEELLKKIPKKNNKKKKKRVVIDSNAGFDDEAELKAIAEARSLGRSVYSLKDKQAHPFQKKKTPQKVHVLVPRRKKRSQ